MKKIICLFAIICMLSDICFGQGIIKRDNPEQIKSTNNQNKSTASLLDEAYNYSVSGNYTKAISIWNKLANQGEDTAMHNIGYCYKKGLGTDKDISVAIKWWEKASAQNNASAKYELGLCYLYGTGVDKDYKKAWDYFDKSCWRGYKYSFAAIGDMIYFGYGREKSVDKSLEWYNHGAELDDPYALWRLSIIYCNGEGSVVQDYDKGFQLALKSANLQFIRAYASVGDYFFFGKGRSIDYESANQWYQKGAELGDALCMYNIGYAYMYGKGFQQDQITGLEWYKKAAELGEENAIEALKKRGIIK